MKHKFVKYLKESCKKSSDEQSSFKYFLNIAFAREISPKVPGGFGSYRNEWVKVSYINTCLFKSFKAVNHKIITV